jgi:hypothetical protein
LLVRGRRHPPEREVLDNAAVQGSWQLSGELEGLLVVLVVGVGEAETEAVLLRLLVGEPVGDGDGEGLHPLTTGRLGEMTDRC